jgi:hypothetical protein
MMMMTNGNNENDSTRAADKRRRREERDRLMREVRVTRERSKRAVIRLEIMRELSER